MFQKAKVPPTQAEERDAVQTVKEDLMALEIVKDIGAEAAASDSALQDALASQALIEDKIAKHAMLEEVLSATVSRCEKVVADIQADAWTSERVFAAFDSDGNGYLDVSELQLALTAVLSFILSRSGWMTLTR